MNLIKSLNKALSLRDEYNLDYDELNELYSVAEKIKKQNGSIFISDISTMIDWYNSNNPKKQLPYIIKDVNDIKKIDDDKKNMYKEYINVINNVSKCKYKPYINKRRNALKPTDQSTINLRRSYPTLL